MKTAIVAPVHIQPSRQWVDALLALTHEADVVIVDDSDGKVELPKEFDVWGYARQLKALGPKLYKRFEQFHKSSACKNFGTWLAYKDGEADTIIVIDSDCIVPSDLIAAHRQALALPGDQWANPLKGTGWYSRGYPHHLRHVDSWANMGLWTHELDLYGSDRVLALPNLPPSEPVCRSRVTASYFPLSGMNVAFRREAIPYMLFLPNFQTDDKEVFSRHDDIWGGYIFQKAVQVHHKVLTFGQPHVYHDTIVNPYEDAAEEVPMIKYEKEFYRAVDLILGSKQESAYVMFTALANNMGRMFPVFRNLKPAFEFWRDAFPRS
jgi:hypothetical protein